MKWAEPTFKASSSTEGLEGGVTLWVVSLSTEYWDYRHGIPVHHQTVKFLYHSKWSASESLHQRTLWAWSTGSSSGSLVTLLFLVSSCLLVPLRKELWVWVWVCVCVCVCAHECAGVTGYEEVINADTGCIHLSSLGASTLCAHPFLNSIISCT